MTLLQLLILGPMPYDPVPTDPFIVTPCCVDPLLLETDLVHCYNLHWTLHYPTRVTIGMPDPIVFIIVGLLRYLLVLQY